MALAGTKPTSTALTHPPDDQVVLGDSSAPKSSTLWQTLKPFGWQGLLLVASVDRAVRTSSEAPGSSVVHRRGLLPRISRTFAVALLDLAAAGKIAPDKRGVRRRGEC